MRPAPIAPPAPYGPVPSTRQLAQHRRAFYGFDRVQSYFGQRKVGLHDGKIYLNNEPLYLRLVLDQGYWPESILTPPSDEAIQYDIRLTKAVNTPGYARFMKQTGHSLDNEYPFFVARELDKFLE